VYGVSTILKSPDAPSAAGTHARANSAIEIVPAAAYANSTLQLRLSDVSGPRGAVTTCRWFKNGEEIPGETAGTLDPGHFRKGDSIEAETTLANGPSVRASAVRILNSPPRIVAASANLQPDPSAKIYVEVSAVDADNDDISYRYTWFVNGRALPNQNGSTIDVSHFKKSDKVYASVVAMDGDGESAAVVADRVEIGSSVPAISSMPPQSLQDGSRFVYQVKTTMADVKNLRFTLANAPDGMTIDRSGRIEWVVPGSRENQSYSVEVHVADPNGGEASQTFQISTAPADTIR